MLPQIIDALVEDMQISTDVADSAKSKFAKLHKAVVEAMTREKQALDEAKMLKRKLDVGDMPSIHTATGIDTANALTLQ